MLIIMEMVEILQDFPKRDRDAKWADAARKSVLTDLVDAGLPQTFIWLFYNCTAVLQLYLWSWIKWGVSAKGVTERRPFCRFLWFRIAFFRSSVLCVSVLHFPFYFWVEHASLWIRSLVDRYVGCLSFSSFVKKVLRSMVRQVSRCTCCLRFSSERSCRVWGWASTQTYEKLPAVFPRSCPIVRSHQQCVKVILVPSSWQCWCGQSETVTTLLAVCWCPVGFNFPSVVTSSHCSAALPRASCLFAVFCDILWSVYWNLLFVYKN